MKRVISLFICVIMCITMFSATAGQVYALGVATDLLTVTRGEFADDTITFTLNFGAGNTKVTGAIVKAYFDSTVLEVVDAGAAGTVDDAGDFVQNVSGIYETGLEYNNSGVYAIGYMNATGYTVGDEDKAFATITFKAISDDRAPATVDFKCIEFVTDDSDDDNDIKKTDGAQDVISHTFHTLSMPRVTEANSFEGGLRVVWSESVGATSYELYRKAVGESVWTLLSSDIGVATEYIDTDTVMGTEYYYTVSASNAYGSTGYDEEGLAGMNFGTIASINAVAVETGAYITWSPLDGAKSYEVYRKLAVSENWQKVSTVTGCEYTDESIVSGVEYNYKVKAINGKYSADMSCAPATVKYIAVPFTTVLNTADGIEIYFEEVGGAEKYVIEKKVAGGDYSVVAEIAAGETDTYIDEDVVVDGQYAYAIQAVASDISSAKKEIATITRLGAPVMGEIQNAADGISFNWSAVNGATEYVIYRRTADSTSWSNCATTENLNYVDKTVSSGVKYTYMVSAKNDTGCGAVSENPIAITFLSVPDNISVAAIENGIEVNWDTVAGAQNYTVYRTVADEENWAVIGTSDTNSFTDTTGQYGVYYKYTVSATANDCESVYDTEGVEGMYFGNVKWIEAAAIRNGAVITWETLEKADSYEIYRKTADDASWQKLAKVSSNQYTDTSMASGVVYFYMVKAYNGNNVSNMVAAPAQIKILAVPTGIAKNVNNGIQITITPVNGAEGYVIEKKIDGEFTVIATLGANETVYVDTDVEAETEYSYIVYATSSDTDSYVYEVGTVLRLSCPKITKITNVIPGVSLTWTPIDDAVGYEVLRKDEYDDEWKVIATLSETTYIDADVFSDEYYSYTINALLADGGVTGYDNEGATYFFLETPDLESVTQVSGGVQFEWSSVDGATGYIVYRKTTGTSWENLGTVEGTSYTDKKDLKTGKYTYTVRAVNGEYQSYFDSGISINYVGVSKPATPKLSKIANTASGVKITWGKVADAEKYIVYRKTYDAKTKKWSGWVNINKNVTTNSYVDKTAKSGTYYLYTVRANNAAGTSGYNTSGIKTYFLATPTVKTANSNSGVTVKWSKSSGATGYIIYRKTTGGWTRVATVKGASTVSYTDKKATAGVTYRYTVKAYYGSYVSAYNTNGVAVRRLTTPTLKSAVSSKSGITVTWSKVTGATGYIVYRKTTGGWSKVATIKSNGTVKYLDKTAKKGVTYKYTVKAYYGTSTSAYNTKGISCKDKY